MVAPMEPAIPKKLHVHIIWPMKGLPSHTTLNETVRRMQ